MKKLLLLLPALLPTALRAALGKRRVQRQESRRVWVTVEELR